MPITHRSSQLQTDESTPSASGEKLRDTPLLNLGYPSKLRCSIRLHIQVLSYFTNIRDRRNGDYENITPISA